MHTGGKGSGPTPFAVPGGHGTHPVAVVSLSRWKKNPGEHGAIQSASDRCISGVKGLAAGHAKHLSAPIGEMNPGEHGRHILVPPGLKVPAGQNSHGVGGLGPRAGWVPAIHKQAVNAGFGWVVCGQFTCLREVDRIGWIWERFDVHDEPMHRDEENATERRTEK